MTDTNATCPIWGTLATKLPISAGFDGERLDSPRAGGRYEITDTALAMLGSLTEEKKLRLTTWIVDQNRLGTAMPSIHSGVVEQLGTMRSLGVAERRDRLLLYFWRKIKRLGDGVQIYGQQSEQTLRNSAELLAWTESLDDREVDYLMRISQEEGLIADGTSLKIGKMLSAKGYAYLDQLQGRSTDSAQAFVAMWFNESTSEAYAEGLAKAIWEAGYKPLRIDQKEHINNIDDEIIAEIRRSRFLVADFTSEPGKPRGGVYFEAGFAHGLNIPVIWTCREDVIGDVHFDTRQFNHIVWTSPEDLRTKLKNRIEAVIGEGPVKPPE